MSSFGETLRNSWLLAVGDSFELSGPSSGGGGDGLPDGPVLTATAVDGDEAPVGRRA